MCSNNYETSHQAHYKPYEVPDGTESMPPNVINQTSGFFRETAVHIPNSFVPQVTAKVCSNTKFFLVFRLVAKKQLHMVVHTLNLLKPNQLLWDKLVQKKHPDLFRTPNSNH